MKRSLVVVPAVCGVVLLAPAPAAHPEGLGPAPKNCAGVVTRGSAGPGFGTVVASFAKLQAVDDFDFAACGQPPRGNP